MDVRSGIEKLGKRFGQNPMNFTVEASLVAELQKILREGDSFSVQGKYKYDKGGKWKFTNYKEEYLDRICRSQDISNVQMEVNIGRPGHNDHRIDLCIFSSNIEQRKIDVVNGTKYFPKEVLEAAIEVKYIKNRNVPPVALEDEDDNWADFDKDIEKLESLPEDTQKFLVVFSNKNIFQTPKDDDESTTMAHKRLKGLREARDDIEVLQFYPADPDN